MNKNFLKNKYSKGSSTLEILIAFGILTITLTSVIVVIFGNQYVSADNQTNNEAIYKNLKNVEITRQLSRQNFSLVQSTSTTEVSGGINFKEVTTITDISQCKKQATTTTSWTTGGKNSFIEFGTILTDKTTALALGGDCIDSTPISNWDNPTRFASDTMSPGKPTSSDELNKMVYIGADKAPYLYIASTTYATLNQTSNIFVTFTNSFSAQNQINSIDAVRYASSGKIYAFGALSSTTKQLAVIDVTNPKTPSATYIGLSSCVTGSNPYGSIVYYYKNRLYLFTPFTAGPEFHIFDVTNPSSISEYTIGSASCKGFEMGDSVNDIVVQDQVISGVNKTIAYVVTDEINKELRIFDVTTPTSISEINYLDQAGAQNGMSLFVIGNKLFIGRQSNPSGADLYVYDISNPYGTLSLLGSVDIGTGVNAIRVVGKFAFIATPKTNQEFQIWNISNLSSIFNVAKYNFGNIVNRGIDYDPDFIYSTGQSTPNFQIIYSP